jgi:hypothetical protein
LTELQGEINDSIEEVQVAVSSVLKSSTSQTLTQYQTHVDEVEAVYVPMLDNFQTLKPGDCRNDAEDILNRTTTNTGYRASNCASVYDTRVRSEIAVATKALSRFDDLYNQVQNIVVKSFIGQNSFVNPEAIEDKIIEIFDLVKGRWEGSKPEIEAVRRNLASAITAQNAELGNCHQANLNYAKNFFKMFEDTVQICIDFDNTPIPFVASGKRFLKAEVDLTPFSQKRAEFETALKHQQPYEWQA